MLNRFRTIKSYIVMLYALIAFLVFSAIYSSIKLSIEMQTLDAQQEAIIQHESANLDIQATTINNKANRLVSDILFLLDTYNIHLADHADFSDLELEWLSFSNRIKIFDQIRFIDVDGNERIRINYSVDGSYLVDERDLQNQKDRYYFVNTISLSDHEVYVSRLDLNIDNGQIEQPLNPAIRLSTPCYAKDGSLAGIIVINYFADDALSELVTTAQNNFGHAFVLNSDGYWIINSEYPEKEWGFMYEDMKDVTFAAEYPNAWSAMNSGSNGYVVAESGVFVYSDVFLSDAYSKSDLDYSAILSDGDFYLVSYLPANSEVGSLFYYTWLTVYAGILKDNALVYLLFLALSVMLGLFVGVTKSKREEIQYFSEYDGLTGVLNRRAGFYNLSKLSSKARNSSKTITICFLDINGLKQVNDTLGHDVGDELIVSVANGIKATVRSNDVVARLGGDEFLIVFWDTDEDSAVRIWSRIVAEFTQINETENRAYVISVSCGVETLTPGASRSIDDAVNAADEKMYANKREIKKDLKVIRENL